MIVTCPNCQARYKLSDAVLAKGARLRCAACDFRWVPPIPPVAEAPPPPRPPITEADEEAAFAAVQEQIRARWHDAANPVAPADPRHADGDAPDDSPTTAGPDYDLGVDSGRAGPDGDDDGPRETSALLRSVIAGIAGLALSVAAAGLWAGQIDLTAVPLVGPAMARLSPQSSLKVNVAGVVNVLPSGGRVLEVSGSISNPGKRPAAVPPLMATLSGPNGTALRWTIPAPLAMLPPGQQVAFDSTVTGFPAEARTLAITPTR